MAELTKDSLQSFPLLPCLLPPFLMYSYFPSHEVPGPLGFPCVPLSYQHELGAPVRAEFCWKLKGSGRYRGRKSQG